MKKQIFTSLFLLIMALPTFITAQDNSTTTFVIHTDYGDMEGILFNDTPQHRDNFIQLINDGWYNNSPFHRVIEGFMIQGGQNSDGRLDPGHKIAAEITPQHIHTKGALAAARQSDQVNPEKESSGSQFYIVQGRPLTLEKINSLEERKNMGLTQNKLLEELTKPENSDIYEEFVCYRDKHMIDSLQLLLAPMVDKINASMVVDNLGYYYTDEQKERYVALGGTPHLDGDYTVFGEITAGLEIIDSIAKQPRGEMDKPLSEINMQIEILK